jgi:hypothetical protein
MHCTSGRDDLKVVKAIAVYGCRSGWTETHRNCSGGAAKNQTTIGRGQFN